MQSGIACPSWWATMSGGQKTNGISTCSLGLPFRVFSIGWKKPCTNLDPWDLASPYGPLLKYGCSFPLPLFAPGIRTPLPYYPPLRGVHFPCHWHSGIATPVPDDVGWEGVRLPSNALPRLLGAARCCAFALWRDERHDVAHMAQRIGRAGASHAHPANVRARNLPRGEPFLSFVARSTRLMRTWDVERRT